MSRDPIINPPAIVESAVNIDREGAELDALLDKIEHGEIALLDWRVEAGNIFLRVRKSIPAKGQKSKAWGDFVRARKVSLVTATRYMKIAEYVAMHPEAKDQGVMAIYQALDIAASGWGRESISADGLVGGAQTLHSSNALYSSASVVWLSGPELRDLLLAFAGERGIALDPTAHPLSIIPARVKWCGPDAGDVDAREQDWAATAAGGLIYDNPPYGQDLKREWAQKIAEEARKGPEMIILVPSRTDTAWWKLLRPLAAGWLSWEGRLRFLEPVGDWRARHPGETPPSEAHPGLVETDPAPFPSAILYFGKRWARFVEVFGEHGQIEGPAVVVSVSREELTPEQIDQARARSAAAAAVQGQMELREGKPFTPSLFPVGTIEGEPRRTASPSAQTVVVEGLGYRVEGCPHPNGHHLSQAAADTCGRINHKENDDEKTTPADQPPAREARGGLLPGGVQRLPDAVRGPDGGDGGAVEQAGGAQVLSGMATGAVGDVPVLAPEIAPLGTAPGSGYEPPPPVGDPLRDAARKGYEMGQEELLVWVAGLLDWPADSTPDRSAIEEAIHVLRNERLTWEEAVQEEAVQRVDRLRSTRDARVAELEEANESRSGQIVELVRENGALMTAAKERVLRAEQERMDALLRAETAEARVLELEGMPVLGEGVEIPARGRKASAERESEEQLSLGDELRVEFEPGVKRAAPAAPPAVTAPELAIACPQCRAPAGESCKNYKRKGCAVHGDRTRAAKTGPASDTGTGPDPLVASAVSLGRDHARTRPKRRSDQAGLIGLLSTGKPEDAEIVKRGSDLYLAYKRSFAEAKGKQ